MKKADLRPSIGNPFTMENRGCIDNSVKNSCAT